MYKDSVDPGMVDELKARGHPFLKVDNGVEDNGILKYSCMKFVNGQ